MTGDALLDNGDICGMMQQEFEDGLRALIAFNMGDLETAGVIRQGDTGTWVDFTRNPYRWVSHLPPERAEKMWELIVANLPVRTISEESAEAMVDIAELATGFGWKGDSSLWRWLREQLQQGQAARADLLQLRDQIAAALL